MYQEVLNKEKKVALIGLGYVGLPIALAFAKKISVIGFDINEERVEMMKKGIDPSKELVAKDFEDSDIVFTANIEDLKAASFYIVAVPTPIDKHQTPNLRPLLSASRTVGQVLKKGDYVVFESTVYPGCTEEDCVPILEELSGLKYKEDFKVGYSPERINPGDKEHTITKITKVVSGCDQESLDDIASVYDIIIDAGTFKASSIKVAEAAKVIENTQRDLNISLMNELSIIFDKMDINTYDVLEAAGTKWNFLRFYPGLVGGHCIGVDPYYLTYKAQTLGYNPQVILSGRRINDNMASYVASKLVKHLIRAGKAVRDSKVLVMGVTFKEDVSDIRNSKVADVVYSLKEYLIDVDVVDPYADSEEVKHEYGFDIRSEITSSYDAVILAVNHKDYKELDYSYFESLMPEGPIILDLKGIFPAFASKTKMYWSL